ncbi:WAP kazal immunoglobulin kunitz and NTR domain-containing protein 2 [Clonorchis sinensis]|uniref:WAP kazal immunoglobulin kunitz and NTR domain-containing protein 2 n=1 Tax=Clonorchis sinensis TaxID=79923 RepID=G7YPK1_CLOSI|nr:WAP kazal immunoglobulin kunitz and NTR domain-containing protein 2 [Clonorchis sinensis]
MSANVKGSTEAFTPAEYCSYNIKQGDCDAGSQRYGFDTKTQQCVPFIFAGKNGNGNNFVTKAHCEQMCLGKLQT